jgi:transcriptional regulator with XRE-family HTH domain
MQMKDWMRDRGLHGHVVAAAIGMTQPYLSQCMHGKRVPSVKLIYRVYELTDGEVTLSDWLECCRPKAILMGILNDGEKVYGIRE